MLHFVSDDSKLTVLGWEFGDRFLRNKFLANPAVGDHVFDRDDAKTVLLSYFHQSISSCPVSIIVEDFAQHASRSQSRHPRQVN